jgi:hypothetical protein
MKMKMSREINSSEIDETYDISEVPIPRSVRLTILILFNVPSSICTIFLLFKAFQSRSMRNSLHNHVIIVLLISVLPTQLFD